MFSNVQKFRLTQVLLLAVFLAACHGIPVEKSTIKPQENPKVVLLHGLKRSAWSMKKIERALDQDGFDVCNINYPSGRALVGPLIDHILGQIESCYGGLPAGLNFVSHSLGGIMVRAIAASGRGPKIGRAVMLAPPNHGSEMVDLHRNSALFRTAMGPMAVYLGTDPGSLPLRLGPATFDVGVIAGSGKSNPLGLWIFNQPNDGTVSVASARLEGMSDFVVVPYGHTFIMRKKPVINEILHFLHHGQFSTQFKQL